MSIVSGEDWYPSTQAGELIMYGNVKSKIDGYKPKYNLSQDFFQKVHTMCDAFIAAFEALTHNRATKKQESGWFERLMKGNPVGEPVAPYPVYQTPALPAGTFVGIETTFRELMDFFKANPAYDAADGDDLMITGNKTDSDAADDTASQPELKLTKTNSDTAVAVGCKIGDFDLIELQWRTAGSEVWQHADKGRLPMEFAPPLTDAGAAEKFEFRAIYIRKNLRVGVWSAIYPLTLG